MRPPSCPPRITGRETRRPHLGRTMIGRCAKGVELLYPTGLPPSSHRVRIARTDVFPVPQICLLDVELVDVVVTVDDVTRGLAHQITQTIGFTCTASQNELIVPLTRKAVQHAARVAAQVAPLWGRFGDGDEEAPFGQQRNHRVHSRASICPDGGQIHEHVVLPQEPSRCGQVGGFSLELTPRRHGRKSTCARPCRQRKAPR